MNKIKKVNKVRVLTVRGRPWGYIVRQYQDPLYHINYEYLYWIRLYDGVLLKDVGANEIEQEYERIEAKCKHNFVPLQDDKTMKMCKKCHYFKNVNE